MAKKTTATTMPEPAPAPEILTGGDVPAEINAPVIAPAQPAAPTRAELVAIKDRENDKANEMRKQNDAAVYAMNKALSDQVAKVKGLERQIARMPV